VTAVTRRTVDDHVRFLMKYYFFFSKHSHGSRFSTSSGSFTCWPTLLRRLIQRKSRRSSKRVATPPSTLPTIVPVALRRLEAEDVPAGVTYWV